MHQNPSLIISNSRHFAAPQVPAATHPEVTRWCNRDGVLGALSHLVANEYWLHVLGVASFKLDPVKNEVVAVACDHATPESIVNEYQSTAWPTLSQLNGFEALHGSAVVADSGVVLFCAPSEAGKSTLAFGLSQRGYPYFADDAVVLEILPHSIRAHPLPFQVHLRSASALHFGFPEDPLSQGRVCRDGQQTNEVLPIKAICLLEQVRHLRGEQVVAIERIFAAEALRGVFGHAIYFSMLDQRRKRRMMQQYLTLISEVAVFKVRLRRGLDYLPAILDQLEQRIIGNKNS